MNALNKSNNKRRTNEWLHICLHFFKDFIRRVRDYERDYENCHVGLCLMESLRAGFQTKCGFPCPFLFKT